MTLTIRNSFASAILLLGALAVGCGSDGDDDSSGDDDTTQPDAGGNGGGDAGMQGKSYRGKTVVSTNVAMILSGKKVWLFDQDTGMKVGDAQTSGSDGYVTFASRDGNYGLFVEGGGEFQDTWNYPPSRKGEEELIRVGTRQAAFAVPALTGYTTDQEASPIAGSVLWHNKATGKDEFVGCAVLEENDGVKDVRYFKAELPTTLAMRSAEQGTQPPKGGPSKDLPENEVEAGKFFAGNVSKGKQTLVIKINGQEVGKREIFVLPRSGGTPIMGASGLVPSNLTLASVYVEGDSNPTPANCQ